jgi:hypothetical protein
MAGQQIADLKYMTMRDAPDWKTWAPIGPGPVRFLNRLHGRPLTKSIPVAQHYLELAQLSEAVKVALPQVAIQHGYSAEVEALVQFHLEDAHNIGSNLLCETDKYLRLKEGGQVRSKYNGAGAPQPKATTHSLI